MIQVKNLSKNFGEVKAVKSINFEINDNYDVEILPESLVEGKKLLIKIFGKKSIANDKIYLKGKRSKKRKSSITKLS